MFVFPLTPNSYAEALIPGETAFEDRAFKEVIRVEWVEPLSQKVNVLIRRVS